jgi:hypothetical protein
MFSVFRKAQDTEITEGLRDVSVEALLTAENTDSLGTEGKAYGLIL